MIKKEKLGIFFILLLVLITLPVISANEDVNSTIDNDFVLVEVNDDINLDSYDEFDENNNLTSDDIFADDYSWNIDRSFEPTYVFNGYQYFIYNLTKYYGNNALFGIAIWDLENTTVPNVPIKFTVNGVDYYRTTNVFGQATLAINLPSGSYTIYTHVMDENNNTFINYINILTTITGNDIVKYYKNATQYTATFRDTSGNLLTNTAITFNINGVTYSRTTNSAGVAQMNINLNPGTYIITATNPVTSEQHSNTITVLPTLTASDLTMNQGDGSKFKAYLVDGQGNPYVGQIVTFNINGVFYNRTTDSNGIANLAINLMQGTYIITSSHNGLNIANTIKVN